MKSLIIALTAIALTLTLVSCASSTGKANLIKYTSDKCVVTGEKINAMGTPITKVYGNQELKFCCEECVRTYEKYPERFASNIR